MLSSLGPWLGALLLRLGVEEPPRSATASEAESYLDTMRAGFIETRASALLLRILWMGVTLGTIWGVVDEFIPVFMIEKTHITVAAIGVIYAAASTINSVAASLAHRLPSRSLAGIGATLLIVEAAA